MALYSGHSSIKESIIEEPREERDTTAIMQKMLRSDVALQLCHPVRGRVCSLVVRVEALRFGLSQTPFCCVCALPYGRGLLEKVRPSVYSEKSGGPPE